MSDTAMPQANQVASGFIGTHAVICADPRCPLGRYPLVVDQHNGKVARVQFRQVLRRGARKDSKQASRQPGPNDAINDITVIFLMIYVSDAIEDEFIRGTAYDFAEALHQLRDERPGQGRDQHTYQATALP